MGFNVRSLGIILVCMGIVVTVLGFVSMDQAHTPPFPLEELNETNIEKDIIVEGDLNYNLGAFEEEYSKINGVKILSTFKYVIPLGDDGYIGLQSCEFVEELDKQSSETYDLWSGESNSYPKAIHIKGQVTKLSGKSLKYLKKYMTEMGMTSDEVDKCVYPYYIAVNDYDEWSKLAVLGPIMIVIGAIMWFVISVLGKKRKAKKTSISTIMKNVEQREEDLKIFDFCYDDDHQSGLDTVKESFGLCLVQSL